MNLKTLAAGLVLVGLGVAHSIWPQRVSLDWPAVALLITGVLFCFSKQVAALLPYVKRLKVGDAEIEIREKLSDLRANVEQLEKEAPKIEAPLTHSKAETFADTAAVSLILDLATKDKSAALVMLAVEIEKEMAQLCKALGIELRSPTWRQLVDALTQKQILEPPLARALIEFRDVRNQVIHSGLRGPVQESLLTPTIDNGLQLLRLLKATAR